MYLYLIQSKKDFSVYIGTTVDLRKRLIEHNKGLSSATKYKRPWILVYAEWYRLRKDVLERERRLKKYKTGWVNPVRKGGALDPALSKNKKAGLYSSPPQGAGLSNGVNLKERVKNSLLSGQS